MASKLDEMAASALASVRSVEQGWFQMRLARGLRVVLERQGARWRLALGRPDVAPSAMEVEICRRAFGVPEGAAELSKVTAHVEPKTQTRVTFRVVELSWVEDVAPVEA